MVETFGFDALAHSRNVIGHHPGKLDDPAQDRFRVEAKIVGQFAPLAHADMPSNSPVGGLRICVVGVRPAGTFQRPSLWKRAVLGWGQQG